AKHVGDDQRTEGSVGEYRSPLRVLCALGELGDRDAETGSLDDLACPLDDASLEHAFDVVGEEPDAPDHDDSSSSSAWITSATAPIAPSWSEYARLRVTASSCSTGTCEAAWWRSWSRNGS